MPLWAASQFPLVCLRPLVGSLFGTMLSGSTWRTRGCQRPGTFLMSRTATGFLISSGFVCDDDIASIIRATVLAIGVSLDKPEDDPERRIAIISDDGWEIGTVPVYSTPSYENPAP